MPTPEEDKLSLFQAIDRNIARVNEIGNKEGKEAAENSIWKYILYWECRLVRAAGWQEDYKKWKGEDTSDAGGCEVRTGT